MPLKTKEDCWESSPKVFEVMNKEQASSEMKLEQLELVAEHLLETRDLLKRTNGFQHCLSDLRDNTALAIFYMSLNIKLDFSLSTCAFIVFICMSFLTLKKIGVDLVAS